MNWMLSNFQVDPTVRNVCRIGSAHKIPYSEGSEVTLESCTTPTRSESGLGLRIRRRLIWLKANELLLWSWAIWYFKSIWRGKKCVILHSMCNALRHNSPPYTVFIQGSGLLGSCILLGFEGTPPYKVQPLITFGVLDKNETVVHSCYTNWSCCQAIPRPMHRTFSATPPHLAEYLTVV